MLCSIIKRSGATQDNITEYLRQLEGSEVLDDKALTACLLWAMSGAKMSAFEPNVAMKYFDDFEAYCEAKEDVALNNVLNKAAVDIPTDVYEALTNNGSEESDLTKDEQLELQSRILKAEQTLQKYREALAPYGYTDNDYDNIRKLKAAKLGIPPEQVEV